MKRVLVVEDEPGIALALEADLTIEGYDVEIASDGESASCRAREGQFDLILLDIMLPKKNGYEVCREVRSAGVQTPILILTAKVQEAEKVLGLELGADDYLTKPFSPLELRARVKALLRRAGAPSSGYRFGQFEVDFGRFELRRDGVVIGLTPLEFKLLATFIQKRGQAISRDRLLDLVWGEEIYVTDRVIDNHVANLRKKIEEEPRSPRFLVSVRGVGYRFEG